MTLDQKIALLTEAVELLTERVKALEARVEETSSFEEVVIYLHPAVAVASVR